MSFTNKMKVELLSKSCNEGLARGIVAAFVSQLDPTISELSDIKTAISEAVTNSIIHGYKDDSGYISIECSIQDNLVEIIIADSGKGIDDVELARQPLYTTQPEMERSGMGFTVMETFMDTLKVESEKDKGTKVTMTKLIKTFEELVPPGANMSH